MNRCKTCKCWDVYKKSDPRGVCTSAKLREWSNARPENAPDELVYSYHEGGTFWTGPEFGCVHWEAK